LSNTSRGNRNPRQEEDIRHVINADPNVFAVRSTGIRSIVLLFSGRIGIGSAHGVGSGGLGQPSDRTLTHLQVGYERDREKTVLVRKRSRKIEEMGRFERGRWW
jgi:hypothetical protein